MLADSHGSTELNGTETSKGGLTVFNCCQQKTEPPITIPVVRPTCYGNKIVFHTIEVNQNLDQYHLENGSNLEEFTRDQISQLNAQNMVFTGFNTNLKALATNFLSGSSENLEAANSSSSLFADHENAHTRQFSKFRNDETSSNIDNLFENQSLENPHKKPVCNLLGNCFNNNPRESNSNLLNNEMLKMTGAMNSFLEGPDFVDLETTEDEELTALSNCCGAKSKTAKLGTRLTTQLSSLLSQNSANGREVGCFGTCSKKLKKLVNLDNVSTMATASSFGLKSLYHSLSQSNFLPSSQSFFDTLPSNLLQHTESYSKYFSFENPKESCFNLNFSSCFKVPTSQSHLVTSSNGHDHNFATSQLLSNRNLASSLNLGTLQGEANQAADPRTGAAANKGQNNRTRLKHLRPNSFKLHAVEIHQYVPFPNLPSSRFVNERKAEQLGPGPLSGYDKLNGQYVANCFFNVNTTGPVAPMMGNLLKGVQTVPEVYNLHTNAQRLNTQDLTMCVLPLGANQAGRTVRLVE